MEAITNRLGQFVKIRILPHTPWELRRACLRPGYLSAIWQPRTRGCMAILGLQLIWLVVNSLVGVVICLVGVVISGSDRLKMLDTYHYHIAYDEPVVSCA